MDAALPLFHLGAWAQREIPPAGDALRAIRETPAADVAGLAGALASRAWAARLAGHPCAPPLDPRASLLAQLCLRGFGVAAEEPERQLLLAARGRIHLLRDWELSPVRDPAELSASGDGQDRLALGFHVARSRGAAPRRLSAELRVRFAARDAGGTVSPGWGALRILAARLLESWLRAAHERLLTRGPAAGGSPIR